MTTTLTLVTMKLHRIHCSVQPKLTQIWNNVSLFERVAQEENNFWRTRVFLKMNKIKPFRTEC